MPAHELAIKAVRHEANETLRVEFHVPEDLRETFRFTQGQYLTLVTELDGQEARRSYSICAAVGEPLAVAIKRIEGGAFSTYAHEQFRSGVRVLVLPPDGQFHTGLAPDQRKDYLCVAAGSGITPIISILKTVLATEPQSRVALLYGNRTTGHIIFREELSWLKNRYMTRFQWVNFLTEEIQEAPILNGRIDNAKGREIHPYLVDIDIFDEFFLCGPQGMVSEITRGLRSRGVPQENIHCELFFASAEDAQQAASRQRLRAEKFGDLKTKVRVKSGGREVLLELTADGESILDSAMNGGLDLPFSCKGGVCATCKARVLEGQVELDLNHALSAEEVAQGYILSCQAHPISDYVVVDFDVN